MTLLALLPAALADKDSLTGFELYQLCQEQVVAASLTRERGLPQVVVYRQDGHSFVRYDRTDRGIADGKGLVPLQEVYGRDVLNPESLRGHRIIDAGCGDGAFVRELNAMGAYPLGLDLVLLANQGSLEYLYRKCDMAQLVEPAESVDEVFVSFATPYYEPENLPLLQRILKRFEYVLKPGGRIFFGGNPASRLRFDDPRRAFLIDGWFGRNLYLESLLPHDSQLRVRPADSERPLAVEFRKQGRWDANARAWVAR